MNKLLKLNGLFLFTFFMCFGLFAQKVVTNNTGAYVYFNLRNSTLPHKKHQQATMLGCNTVIVIDSTSPKGYNGLQWDSSYQVFPGYVPYGTYTDSKTNKSYYVSKYYIASPPVFAPSKDNKPLPNSTYDIGIVTPDEFTLAGKKPVQPVYMDYNILKLTKIEYLPVVFDTSFKYPVDTLVPFRVECPDFPWLNTKALPNAKGASGIGFISYNPSRPEKLFLPYYLQAMQFGSRSDSVKTYLDFQVTILNDILLNYEVFFSINDVSYTTINLTQYRDGNTPIYLTRRRRNATDIPCGCQKPKACKL